MLINEDKYASKFTVKIEVFFEQKRINSLKCFLKELIYVLLMIFIYTKKSLIYRRIKKNNHILISIFIIKNGVLILCFQIEPIEPLKDTCAIFFVFPT